MKLNKTVLSQITVKTLRNAKLHKTFEIQNLV